MSIETDPDVIEPPCNVADDIECSSITGTESPKTSLAADAHAPDNAAERQDVPPDGGYGWVCVLCVFLINGQTWGLNSAYGVFLSHFLSNETYPDATPLWYAFIGGLSISQALFVSPLSTLSTRYWGTRATLSIGIVIETLALIGSSLSKSIWQLLLSQGVCFGWGMGFLYNGSINIIPQWFSSKRSLANGITASGAGIWGIVYNLLGGAMIQRLGVPWAYRVLAICGFFFNFVSLILVRDRNKVVNARQSAFDFRLFARPEFILLLGWGFLSEWGYIALLYSLPDYATSIGLSAQQGSVVGAMLNLGLGIGRPLVGYFSDTLGRINIALLMTAFCGLISFVLWTLAKSYGLLLLFAILAGSACGTFWATVAPVGAEVSNLKELPNILGMLWLVLVIPTTCELMRPGTFRGC